MLVLISKNRIQKNINIAINIDHAIGLIFLNKITGTIRISGAEKAIIHLFNLNFFINFLDKYIDPNTNVIIEIIYIANISIFIFYPLFAFIFYE
jgi:hypothetical protein